ncbi:alkylhydroperoxidase AhpD family core domain-containing protein [Streptomyces sp. DvalAA-14]|uniref:carboxymuconolactone decarboxylase family protein n=1 Tax=unclassified Streptomyces TaxID=2593676 RepID=UPI00081B32D7|nr:MULTISPECIES: carboxymuconolactone decarboxylase family protein [unclassified Streptomyces]MYS19730.1 carboxymuconolactone decarboxylase family protein [Streptomyces sp. SID4948]SCD51689.1 alkylhydroperoxidase AhpD family core domain-containing protein [Streptomyces sp. DvalAA-14]
MTEEAVNTRLSYARHAPDVLRTMLAFGEAATKGLDPVLAELVKIRASQINRCAYCLDLHLAQARKAGESERRIDLLSVWDEVEGVYTDQERAALALTEAVTELTDGFVPDAVYERAAAHFDEAELARLVSAVVAINAWNRFNVTFRTPPGGTK